MTEEQLLSMAPNDMSLEQILHLQLYAIRMREALEWIANDGYKVVPSHWDSIAKAQMECAGQALSGER